MAFRLSHPVVLVVVLGLLGCAPAAAPPAASVEPLPPGAATINLAARNSKFDAAELHVRGGEEFIVVLRNDDADVHNFEVRDEAGTTLFRGELVRGPAEVHELVPPLPAGRYAFLCTAHPYMKGTLLAD